MKKRGENIHNNEDGVTFQNTKCQFHLFMSFVTVLYFALYFGAKRRQ